MHTPHPFDLVIGLDRSDKKADLHLLHTTSLQCSSIVIDTAPEALRQWLLQLRQQHPHARIALCLEQPAGHLVSFLEAYDWITLYPINPITLQKYREAFVTSRAKDDARDALYLAELLLNHAEKLKPWAPEDSATRAVQQLVFHRRTRLSLDPMALRAAGAVGCRHCLLASIGHGLSAQVAQPGRGQEDQSSHAQSILLSARQPQPETRRAAFGVD